MHHTIHELKNLLRASFIAALVGGLAAAAGLAIEGWNVDHFGAEYSSYRFHWLALGALPGMMITEVLFGPDFQLGEIMQHRSAVIGWNALAYAGLGAGAYALFRLVARPATTVRPIEAKLPNKS